MPIDFVPTYPCYAPMFRPDEPRTGHSPDGSNEQSVVLITDKDLVTEFFEAQNIKRPWLIETLTDADAVVDFLEYHAARTVKGFPITHVAIDPGIPSRLVRWYPIPEFVRHIS